MGEFIDVYFFQFTFLFEICMCMYVCINAYVCMLSVNVVYECQGIEREVRGQPMLVPAFCLV